jgi:hypothetical protein
MAQDDGNDVDLAGLQPIEFQDEGDVEYVVGMPPNTDNIHPDDIRKKLADLEAQNTVLKAQADQTAALSKSFGDYGQQVQKAIERQPQPAPSQPAPGEDWNAFMTRINTQFFEKPAETIQEVLTRYDNLKSSQQVNQSMVVAKRFLALDPEAKPIYDKYRDEVDREMSTIDPQVKLSDPTFYRDAIDRVKSRHLDDLIAEKVAEALAKVQQPAPTSQPRSPTYAETGGVSRAVPQGQSSAARQVFIPPHIAAEADAIGMDAKDLYNIRKQQGRV